KTRQGQSGTFKVPLEKVIWSAAAGVAGMSGTFCDFVMTELVEDRGVVRTTWLGGMAVPDLRWSYIKSRLSMTYRWRGMKRVWYPENAEMKKSKCCALVTS